MDTNNSKPDHYLQILSVVQKDINKRKIFHIIPNNNNEVLFKLSQQLIASKQVIILTGFQCNYQFDMKAESDGIAGTIDMAVQLAKVGNKEKIRILIDKSYAKLFSEILASHLASETYLSQMYTKEQLSQLISVEGFTEKQLTKEEIDQLTLYQKETDSFIAIERPSVTANNNYCTMRAYDISNFTSPIDQILFPTIKNHSEQKFQNKCYIGIGDGGNEVGMGHVYENVVKYVDFGDKIAAFTTSNYLITCDVSNWGGYAICYGILLQMLQNSKSDQKKSCIQKFSINSGAEIQLHKVIAQKGFRDGINKELNCTVDGQPLDKSIDIIKNMNQIVEEKIL